MLKEHKKSARDLELREKDPDQLLFSWFSGISDMEWKYNLQVAV